MGYLYTCLATLNYGCGNIVCEVYNRKVKKVNSFCYTMMLSFVLSVLRKVPFYFRQNDDDIRRVVRRMLLRMYRRAVKGFENRIRFAHLAYIFLFFDTSRAVRDFRLFDQSVRRVLFRIGVVCRFALLPRQKENVRREKEFFRKMADLRSCGFFCERRLFDIANASAKAL